MNSIHCIKDAKGSHSKITANGRGTTHYNCCGIMDYGSAWVSEEPEGPFFTVPSALRRAAAKRREVYDKISADMVRDFGGYRTVFMTDKVDGYNHKLMKLFRHPEWKKKITLSEQPNQNTGHPLVTCLLLKKDPNKKKAAKNV